MTERVHSNSVKKIPSSITSRFSFTLTECRCYYTAIQVLKSMHKFYPSSLQDIFRYSKDITGHFGHNTCPIISLFPGCIATGPILGKGPFIIMGVFCGTINCCGGYFSFFFQKNLLTSRIVDKCYFFVLALCVCVHV